MTIRFRNGSSRSPLRDGYLEQECEFSKWLISHTRKIVNLIYVPVTTSSGFHDLINAILLHFNCNKMSHKATKWEISCTYHCDVRIKKGRKWKLQNTRRLSWNSEKRDHILRRFLVEFWMGLISRRDSKWNFFVKVWYALCKQDTHAFKINGGIWNKKIIANCDFLSRGINWSHSG